VASAVKRGVARTTDAPAATARDAARAFTGAKPSLPTSVVVDGRLVDVKAVVSRTEVREGERARALARVCTPARVLFRRAMACSAFCCKVRVRVLMLWFRLIFVCLVVSAGALM
jgi:hypothetical protein